jgi:NADH-quinone oxidoreductase subunit K
MNIQEMLMAINLIFFIGISGIALNRNNLLVVLMSIEIMLLAVNLNFLVFAFKFDDIMGQICVLIILAIAAIESSIGLAILCTYNTVKDDISF